MRIVSESKVRVVPFFIASQMLLTKSGGKVVSVAIVLTRPLMHAHTFINIKCAEVKKLKATFRI